jgi:uncharacterized protein (TIGR00369 family)
MEAPTSSDGDHFRKLERMYHAAPVNDFYAPRLRVSEGRAVLEMDIRREFFHAAGAIHGSICFKALDDAAFFAVNSLERDVFIFTVSFNVYLLRPVSEGTLRAEGVVTSSSRNLYTAESVLYVGEHRQVARGSGTFMRSSIRLLDVESYR